MKKTEGKTKDDDNNVQPMKRRKNQDFNKSSTSSCNGVSSNCSETEAKEVVLNVNAEENQNQQTNGKEKSYEEILAENMELKKQLEEVSFLFFNTEYWEEQFYLALGLSHTAHYIFSIWTEHVDMPKLLQVRKSMGHCCRIAPDYKNHDFRYIDEEFCRSLKTLKDLRNSSYATAGQFLLSESARPKKEPEVAKCANLTEISARSSKYSPQPDWAPIGFAILQSFHVRLRSCRPQGLILEHLLLAVLFRLSHDMRLPLKFTVPLAPTHARPKISPRRIMVESPMGAVGNIQVLNVKVTDEMKRRACGEEGCSLEFGEDTAFSENDMIKCWNIKNPRDFPLVAVGLGGGKRQNTPVSYLPKVTTLRWTPTFKAPETTQILWNGYELWWAMLVPGNPSYFVSGENENIQFKPTVAESEGVGLEIATQLADRWRLALVTLMEQNPLPADVIQPKRKREDGESAAASMNNSNNGRNVAVIDLTQESPTEKICPSPPSIHCQPKERVVHWVQESLRFWPTSSIMTPASPIVIATGNSNANVPPMETPTAAAAAPPNPQG